MIAEILDTSVDVEKINEEIIKYKKQKAQAEGAQRKIHNQMDTLDVTDKYYEKKYDDLVLRDNELYHIIGEFEEEIETLQTRIDNIQNNKLNKEAIFKLMDHFSEIYPLMSYAEKKMYFQLFIDSVEIYPEPGDNGKILKRIVFKLPLLYNNQEATEIRWDYPGHVETIVCLCKQ